MSKIGKKSITLPSGTTVTVSDATVTVKGSKGTLSRRIPTGISIAVEGSEVSVMPAGERPTRAQRAQWGLWRALVNNMIVGVSTGWSESLEFQGVGYRAALKGRDLELSLGYSHPITIPAPEGITFVPDKTSIRVEGIDKELVGHVAAKVRSQRQPEPYKGSGIRYADEIIKKKAGKKAATAA
ncbi:MAG: 50S ribosomal protein L6 [Candidatus Yanofskybacteria bacterium]|nr:50S ribosomal protein L6 [Candidatus Yanofskybacteria bacterium]